MFVGIIDIYKPLFSFCKLLHIFLDMAEINLKVHLLLLFS